MLRLAVGHSADIDLERALDETVAQAREDLGGDEPGAALLFVSSGLDHEAVRRRVRGAFPGVPLVGCTSAGEASSSLGFQDDSILLLLFVSPDVRFSAAIGRAPSSDPERAIVEALEQIQAQASDEPPRLCFLLSDAVLSNPDHVLEGLRQAYGESLPVVGGAAASYPPGGETWVLFDDESLSDAFVLLALHGPLELATAAETSWCPIGKPGTITAVEGDEVLRIDDVSALAFYRNALGADASQFLGTPLAILDADGSFKIRAALIYDAARESVAVIGGLAVGDRVQLAFATVDDVRDGATALIERGLAQFPGQDGPAFVFFCSCAARKMFLALDVESEIEQLRLRLGRQVPIVGFYGYGEIGSESLRDPAKFHNQAIVLAAVR